MHVLMDWHESGFLGGTKPMNQLVANVWKSSDGLKVIPVALNKVILCSIACFLAAISHNVGPLGETYALETLFHQHKQCIYIVLLVFRNSTKNP